MEDEYLIVDKIVEALEAVSVMVTGPPPGVAEALAAVHAGEPLDGAVLDINLHGKMIWPVVEVLKDRGVPMVLATGYDTDAIPLAHAHLTRCEKPVGAAVITCALARALSEG